MTGALVLGGGGAAAVAWELGVLAGLAERGFDATGLRTIVGTSAGAVVACRLMVGTPVADLLAEARRPPVTAPVAVDFPALMAKLADLAAGAPSPVAARQRIGAFALSAATPSAARRRAEIAALAGIDEASRWPVDVDLIVTAVDARSGEFVTFDRDSGVGLLDAVSAGCAVPGVWAPVRIGDRDFLDGAVRSAVNARPVAAAETALILAPFGEPGSLARELREFAGDAVVALVSADPESLKAFGTNPLDAAVSAGAADAGWSQGRGLGGLAERLRVRLGQRDTDRAGRG